MSSRVVGRPAIHWPHDWGISWSRHRRISRPVAGDQVPGHGDLAGQIRGFPPRDKTLIPPGAGHDSTGILGAGFPGSDGS